MRAALGFEWLFRGGYAWGGYGSRDGNVPGGGYGGRVTGAVIRCGKTPLVTFLWQSHRYYDMLMWRSHRRAALGESKLDLLQGTLDLMVLQTLAAMGSQHGYGIARRIEQVSGDAVLLNQGTIYASLVRLQQRGWISAEWGISDNNRKAKFYAITTQGRAQLAEDAAYWQRLSDVMGRVLAMPPGRR